MAFSFAEKLLRAANSDQSTAEGRFLRAEAENALDDAYRASLRERGLAHVARRLLDSAHAEDALRKSRK